MSRFDLPLPRTGRPIWFSAALVVAGYPAIGFVYYPALQRSGALPTDGDSIAIPMFSGVLAALVLLPLVTAATYLCLRGRRDGGTLLAWRKDKPARSFVVTLLFGLPAVLLAVFLAALLTDLVAERAPWFDYLWAPYVAVCIVWLLLLRASALAPRSAPGS